jgi:sugar/nucleoside kinase (ribokinase family)
MLETLNNYVNGIIVITDGPRSIHALSGMTHYLKEVPYSKVIDSTGAGDAFAAGFVYGIMQGHGIEKALNYGVKEAKAVLGAVGAKNNLLRSL